MEEKNMNIDEEVRIDLKGTISGMVKEEKPEMTQEEAIKNYKDENIKKKKKNATEDDESAYNEELEHLERIKKELLASLERVKKLEEKLFGEKAKEKNNIEKVKVKDVKHKEIKQERIVSQEKDNDDIIQDI